MSLGVGETPNGSIMMLARHFLARRLDRGSWRGGDADHSREREATLTGGLGILDLLV